MRISLIRAGGLAALALVATAVVAVPPATGATAAARSAGKGSAYGAGVDVRLLPGTVGTDGVTVRTGPLARSFSTRPTSASTGTVPARGVLTAKAVSSASRHNRTTGRVYSEATVANAELPLVGKVLNTTPPSATLIKSACLATTRGITGSTNLSGLRLGIYGSLPNRPAVNQTLQIPGVLRIIANQQIRNRNGSLTVNALRLQSVGPDTAAPGRIDIVLGSSTCGPATKPARHKHPKHKHPKPPHHRPHR